MTEASRIVLEGFEINVDACSAVSGPLHGRPRPGDVERVMRLVAQAQQRALDAA